MHNDSQHTFITMTLTITPLITMTFTHSATYYIDKIILFNTMTLTIMPLIKMPLTIMTFIKMTLTIMPFITIYS